MPKSLKDYRKYIFAFLIIGAPLSFIPSLATPALDFPSFRLGLYQILAGLFVAITIVPLYKDLNKLFGLNKIAYTSVTIIAFTVMLSLFFSGSQSRGSLLSVSVIFLIVLLLCAWWYVATQIKKVPKIFIELFLLSSVVIAILAIFQLMWGTFTDNGGFLCKGCKSDIFGFPRVNVTAAEPLFIANSLLPVLITSAYLSFKKYKYADLSLFATIFVITLTFARGGYLAASLGLLTIFSLAYIYKKVTIRQLLHSLGLVLAAGVLALVFLLGSATIRFYNTTPNITYNTLQSMTEHLTLGVIQLPDKQITVITNNDPSDDFESPGLIEASTNERLNSAELALDAWQDSIKNIVIGTGLGNLGPYVVNNISPSAPSNLTVYIFYILFLAELGLVGLLALITLVFNIAYKLFKKAASHPIFIIMLGILVAFTAQYFFFGSYINVVYIWLWLGIMLGLLSNDKLTLKGIIGKGKTK